MFSLQCFTCLLVLLILSMAIMWPFDQVCHRPSLMLWRRTSVTQWSPQSCNYRLKITISFIASCTIIIAFTTHHLVHRVMYQRTLTPKLFHRQTLSISSRCHFYSAERRVN
jgi:hypothetical protein